jgi:hypothetical protein
MYPSYIPLRTVTIGGAMGIETGVPLRVRVVIRSDRSLVWDDTGYRFERVGYDGTSEPGEEIALLLPRTNAQGWRDPVTNTMIGITRVDQFTHRYTADVSFLDASGVARGQALTIGPFVVPGGADPLDLDKLLPTTTVAGERISIPDTWGAAVRQAQQAAAEAAQALETMAGGTYLKKVRTGFYVPIDR